MGKMIMGMVKRFSSLFLLCCVFSLHAQIGNMGKNQNLGNANPVQEDPNNKPTTKDYTGKGSAVVDDSTRNIYGPKTSKWITEKEVFYNKLKDYKPLDTTLLNMHRWTYVQRFNYFYQDLGNMGTALNPIFPTVNSSIGASTGFTSYHLYYDTEEPVYFDTKSAYSSFYVIWGGDGRAYTKVKFSRNISPRWNFGFDYRPLFVDRQVQRQRKGDRQVVSHYYDFYTSYFSKNKKYSLLGSFRRFRHLVEEGGGLFSEKDALELTDYLEKDKIQNTLKVAQTEEFRRLYHFWHQYTVNDGLQIYQTIDTERRANFFRDKRGSETHYDAFFKQTLVTPGVDPTITSDKSVMISSQLETGAKGNLAFLFYNVFHKIRRYQFQNTNLFNYQIGNVYWGTENSIGGRVNLRFDSLTSLQGTAEYLLFGRYAINAQFDSKWLEAKVASALAKPGFMPQYYKGAHDFWVQPLHDTFSNQLDAALKFDRDFISLKAGASYTTFNNRIYFAIEPEADKKQSDIIRPYQSKGTQQYFSPKVDFTIPLGAKLKFRGQSIYSKTTTNSDDVLQLPKLFVNGQFCYEHWMFKKAIFVQGGIDVHWQSAYYAYGYAPTIQQFYRQTKFETPSYILTDLFINGQFKRGRFFVKWHNVLQTKYLALSLYIPTPSYPGVGSILDFGFELYLFD